MDELRSKTVTWHDPMAGAAAAMRMSGLDYLRAMKDGTIPPPPIITLMNMELGAVDEGRVEFRCSPDESHYNPIGRVHGGFVCTVLDSAAGCAVQSTLPIGVGYTSLDLNVKFLRPVTVKSGRLACTGNVLQKGRRTALTEARLTDSQGRLIAHATSSCMIFEAS